MTTFQHNIEKYARLAVEVGVNIQPGQTLSLNAPLEAAPLVREIVKAAYARGAKHVYVDYIDEQLTHSRFKYAPDEAFTEFPEWLKLRGETLSENGAAFMSIYAPNPDLLQDIDPKRLQTWTITQATAMAKYRQRMMAHEVAWSLISIPTEPWATKVFPELSAEEAVAKLWDVIFDVTRVSLEDPIAAWHEHNATLKKTQDILNEKRYKTLVYEGPGTNLHLDLVQDHIWLGGSEHNAVGTEFNANMPTEEVFSMPDRNGVNGTVSSTLPLNYNGNLIDKFTLTFKDGEVVEYTAEVGYEALKSLLETDEGARRLGEVALVPHDSPISNSGIIFFNTLFDENASCHLALGKAYPVNIKGGTTGTEEELLERGVNTSLTHVDFMIGSAELNIYGITQDGEREAVFLNGNWAF